MCPYVKACWKGWSSYGLPQKFLQGGQRRHFANRFRLLTLQCKWTFTKHFTVSTPQRKFPIRARAPIASILKSFWSGAVGYTNLLNWSIKLVTIVNSTQMSLKWTWTINNYVCGSLIGLCWLNRTHFWNLLSKLYSTLRLSEMLLLFINCLISIFASTFYKQVIIKNNQRSDQH